MLDCHCHFLPNIDDGPSTLSESLKLAQMAEENGITHSVLTPHIHPGRYSNQRKNIDRAIKNFSSTLVENDIGLKVSGAAEVRICPEILPMVESDSIPFLGELDGYKIILLEFPHDCIPVGSENLVDWLMKRNIRPMIAHPERNKDVMRDINKIIPFINRDCLLQITADSIANKFGEQAHARSVDLLERGWVHIIATDAHNVKYRYPDLAAGRDAAAKIIGEEEANKLVEDNPKEMLGF